MQTASTALWYCATCGRDATAGDRHCRRCGDSLDAMQHVVDLQSLEAELAGSGAATSVFCVECGLVLRAGGRYCSVCGAPADGVRQLAGVTVSEPRSGYASVTRRAGAWCLDLIFVSFVWMVVSALVVPVAALGAALFIPMNGLESDAEILAMLFVIAFVMAVGAGTFLAIDGVYQVVSLVRSGRTLGARAFGIRVVGEDGRRLSFGRAFARWLGSYLSWLVLGIGYLMPLADGRRQTLHDKLAGSFVVRDDGHTGASQDQAVQRVNW